MDNYKTIATTINAVGVVQVKNDLVNFSISLRTKSEVLTDCQDQLEEKIVQALDMLGLKSKKIKGKKPETEFVVERANFKLEHREGSEKYTAGYQSAATISWTVAVDDKMDDTYKICLKLDANAPRPSFSLKDQDSLQEQALQKAKEHLELTLQKECELLGVQSSDLKILNWNIGYNGQLAPSHTSSGNYYYNGTVGVSGAMGLWGHGEPLDLQVRKE